MNKPQRSQARYKKLEIVVSLFLNLNYHKHVSHQVLYHSYASKITSWTLFILAQSPCSKLPCTMPILPCIKHADVDVMVPRGGIKNQLFPRLYYLVLNVSTNFVLNIPEFHQYLGELLLLCFRRFFDFIFLQTSNMQFTFLCL